MTCASGVDLTEFLARSRCVDKSSTKKRSSTAFGVMSARSGFFRRFSATALLFATTFVAKKRNSRRTHGRRTPGHRNSPPKSEKSSRRCHHMAGRGGRPREPRETGRRIYIDHRWIDHLHVLCDPQRGNALLTNVPERSHPFTAQGPELLPTRPRLRMAFLCLEAKPARLHARRSPNNSALRQNKADRAGPIELNQSDFLDALSLIRHITKWTDASDTVIIHENLCNHGLKKILCNCFQNWRYVPRWLPSFLRRMIRSPAFLR